MVTRTQLNINIDPYLLRLIRQKAIISESTVGDHLNNMIKCHLIREELQSSDPVYTQRINILEERISRTNELINNLIEKAKIKSSSISVDDTEMYSILLSKQFNIYAKDEMISRKKAWNIFIKNSSANVIDISHLNIIQDVLRGELKLSEDKIIEFIKYYGYCPIIQVLSSMLNGNLLPELSTLSDRFIEYSKAYKI